MGVNKNQFKILIKKHKLLISIVFISLIMCAFQGYFPGLAQRLDAHYIWQGAIECGAEIPTKLFNARCGFTGINVGGIFPTNLPFYILGSLINMLPGINELVSYYFASFIFTSIALYGSYKFFSLATNKGFIALFVASLYFLSPIIFYLQGFGGTGWGVMFLPGMLYISNLLIDKSIKSNKKVYKINVLPLIFIALLLTSIFTLFLDGYSFFMFIVSSSILAAFYLKKNKKIFSRLFIFEIILAISSLISYLVYTRTLGVEEFDRSPPGIFRAMSLDPVTTLIPTVKSWLFTLINYENRWSNLFGDGTNTNNYIGIFLFVVFIYGLFKIIKNKKLNSLNLAILTIGIFGLVMSFGPTLKFNSTRPEVENVTYETYFMESDDGIIDLPTQYIFKAPGFSSMRATYRWFALTQLSILFVAAYGIDKLNKKYNLTITIALMTLLVIDVIPSPIYRIYENSERNRQFETFAEEVQEPLDYALNDYEKIVFYPNSNGNNDYLVNYISPKAKVFSYNVGNDKAFLNSYPQWPQEIFELVLYKDLTKDRTIQLINEAFIKDQIDALIIPRFDLRWDAYSWPPDYIGDKRESLIIDLDKNQNFTVDDYGRFVVVRTIKK